MVSDTTKELLAGSFGGIVQTLVGQPFDTVKVRLQTGDRLSMGGVVKALYKADGVRGFYRGSLAPLVGVGVCVSLQFAALGAAIRMLRDKDNSISLPRLYLAGAFSGLANSVLSGPIEHVRIRLQVKLSSHRYYCT